MPRKVGPLPPVLRIESLSTGHEIRPGSFMTDIGECETLPMVQDQRPVRVMRSGNEILNEIKQRKIAAKRELLVTVGILPKPKVEPKPIAPVIPGMRPIGKLGDSRALYIPLPPWRRY